MTRSVQFPALLVIAALSSFAAHSQNQSGRIVVEQQTGDVLSMPEPLTEPPYPQQRRTNAPVNGMSKATVIQRYGQPLRREGAVGDPPISVWYYDGFHVFFEYHLVLHSVVDNQKPTLYYPE